MEANSIKLKADCIAKFAKRNVRDFMSFRKRILNLACKC